MVSDVTVAPPSRPAGDGVGEASRPMPKPAAAGGLGEDSGSGLKRTGDAAGGGAALRASYCDVIGRGGESGDEMDSRGKRGGTMVSASIKSRGMAFMAALVRGSSRCKAGGSWVCHGRLGGGSELGEGERRGGEVGLWDDEPAGDVSDPALCSR